MEYGGFSNTQFTTIWKSKIPLKIKIFLWLLRNDGILTKSNLAKRGWQGNLDCPFCGSFESIDHLFVTCPFITAIWSWIAHHNGFRYDCTTLEDLWLLDAYIPLKDTLLVEMIRAATLWTIWLARNRLCFHDVSVPSLTSIGTSIISLTSYWCKVRQDNSFFKLTLIMPMDVSSLAQGGLLIMLSDSDTHDVGCNQALEGGLGSEDLSTYLRNRVEYDGFSVSDPSSPSSYSCFSVDSHTGASCFTCSS